MSWNSVKLGELYTVHNGLSKGSKFFGSGYPFLTFSTVFNNYFIPPELDSFVQSSEAERQNYSIKRGDVFVTRTSETSDELGMSCVALKDYPNATYNGFTKRMRPFRGVQLRKHSKAREKRYSFGYAVSFIFACYQILWTFPKSRYLCSRYLPLACG